MYKKILYILNEAKCVNNFSYTAMMAAQKMGWEFHIAGSWGYESDEVRHQDEMKYGISIHQIDFVRNPIHPANMRAYKQLCAVIEREKFDIIHCNTPIGGICGRLAGKKFGISPVIYQAHGFHFYKGAPLFNWLLYYPVEWLFAYWTDTLITINSEDYEFAKKHLHAKKVEYVPGVGLDLKRFSGEIAVSPDKRKETGIPEDKIWLLSVGELSKRKNHEIILRAIADMPDIYYTVAGCGDLKEYLEALIAELQLQDRVRLLGYRTDISELCSAADVFALPSFQEGLPVALMEAMASGLPVVCSRIRGNTDLVDEKGGYFFDPHDVGDAKNALKNVLGGDLVSMGAYNRNKIKHYDINAVMDDMSGIYGGGMST